MQWIRQIITELSSPLDTNTAVYSTALNEPPLLLLLLLLLNLLLLLLLVVVVLLLWFVSAADCNVFDETAVGKCTECEVADNEEDADVEEVRWCTAAADDEFDTSNDDDDDEEDGSSGTTAESDRDREWIKPLCARGWRWISCIKPPRIK